MTRIIAGVAGGRRLLTPEGDATRPTTDRAREALFSSLESQLGGWADVRMLDVFAGSGAVGLEALSRGADHATFIEQDRRTADLIRRNLRTLDLGEATVVATSAARGVTRLEGRFDVVFLDPPYSYSDGDLATVLDALVADDRLVDDAIVVVERSAKSPEPPWPAGITDERRKKYGATALWYGHRHA